ncbi:hypothetical protein ACFV6F_15040 [Kitasatospora phosalacinea]|uniref:hypothetical protein n=1 Tax=Kitasatospora phosalacinea TaxID=2065 RepID=UPI003663819C
MGTGDPSADTRTPAEREKKEGRSRMFALLVLLVVAAGGGTWWLLRRGTGVPDAAADRREIGRIVLLAHGPDWAERHGVDTRQLSAALLDGADPALLHRVDTEVGPVDLRFHGSGSRTRVTVTAEYDGPRGHAKATADLPWDDVPRQVRADLLRGGAAVLRTWRAAR